MDWQSNAPLMEKMIWVINIDGISLVINISHFAFFSHTTHLVYLVHCSFFNSVPPTKIELTPSQTNHLRVGDNLTLTCSSDSSNSVAQLTWQTEIENEQQPTESLPGDFNGYYLRGTLLIAARKEDNGKVTTCQVNASGNSLEKSYTVNVTCKFSFQQMFTSFIKHWVSILVVYQ